MTKRLHDDALLSDEQRYWLDILRSHTQSCGAGDECATFRHLVFRCWEAGIAEAVVILAGRLTRERMRKLVVEEVREDALFAEEMSRA